MGFLNSLISKNKSFQNTSVNNLAKLSCDPLKTEAVVELLKTSKDKRDENWRNSFFENILTASFPECIPQIIFGDDSFPYFVLKTIENHNPFESYCIKNMQENILLKRGIGVVINPEGNDADWVFSYGDILNLKINNEFISKTNYKIHHNPELLKNKDDFHIVKLSEIYLPNFTRLLLKNCLLKIGVKKPKFMVIQRQDNNPFVPELVFNLFSEDLSSTNELNLYINQLSWYLPKHYIISTISKNSYLLSNFEIL